MVHLVFTNHPPARESLMCDPGAIGTLLFNQLHPRYPLMCDSGAIGTARLRRQRPTEVLPFTALPPTAMEGEEVCVCSG